MNYDTAMEFIHYSQNIAFTVFGLLFALEYTIKAAREPSNLGGCMYSVAAVFGGVAGLWNLICLLEKLNVIQP